jgi:peptidoglycan/LPS O-acetylase OafA/YrhL
VEPAVTRTGMKDLLKPFSRITTAGRTFLPHVDGLRFIAIMAVIAFHVRQIISSPHHFNVPLDTTRDVINKFFEAGCYGVQLFFAISGFILILPFAKSHLGLGEPVKLKAYFLRRLTRLEPPYIIHLILLFVLCCTLYRHTPAHPEYYHNPAWFDFTWKHLLASLFYANGFVFGTHPMPNIVLWSLEVEVQFYLLAPLLALLFKIADAWLRRGLLIGLIGLLPLAAPTVAGGYLLGFSLIGNLQFFLVGFLWCDLYLTRWQAHPARTWLWDLPWLLVLPVIAGHASIPQFYHWLPWLNLLMGLTAFRGRWSGGFFSNPWIMTIGGMCYTIYMYHSLLIGIIIRLTAPLHFGPFWLTLLVQFLVMTPLIILPAAVLFVLFERPFMRRDWPARVKNFLVRPKPTP